MPAVVSRRSRLLGEVDPTDLRGLEFGPLANPVVRPDEGRISYVDYLSTDRLADKYRDDPAVDITQIVAVDFILEEGRLPPDALTGSFDYAIASHVLEHLPDPIGWLEQCASALKPDGVLCLALPDKRYTWDILRPETELAEWVDGYLTSRVAPSPAQVFAATSRTARMAAGTPWQRPPTDEELRPDRELEGALELAREALEAHVDVHCSVFTPRRFLELLADLHRLGLCSFELAEVEATPPGAIEFFVRLRHRPDVDHDRAAEALAGAAAELDPAPSPRPGWRRVAARLRRAS